MILISRYNFSFLLIALIFPLPHDGIFSTNNYSEEYVLVYIGSGTCSACSDSRNASSLSSIDTILRQELDLDNFYTIGVSINNDHQTGYKHLSNLPIEFDEIIISDKLSNIGSHRYMINTFRGRIFVPQLILLKRNYYYKNIGNYKLRIEYDNEYEIYRQLGLDAIDEFSEILEGFDFDNY